MAKTSLRPTERALSRSRLPSSSFSRHRARSLAMAALGVTVPEQANLTKSPMRARTEVSRAGGALRAKTRLEAGRRDQMSFWAFVRGKPSANLYENALQAGGVNVGADGSLAEADGKGHRDRRFVPR